MHEHSESSEGFLVMDLTSTEEDAAPDTSQDEEIACKLFGDLNCGLLGPLGDNNVIILSDSEEEDEMREDDRVDTEVASSSARNSPAPAAIDEDTPDEVQGDSSGGGTPQSSAK
jgi:hypothetical protein